MDDQKRAVEVWRVYQIISAQHRLVKFCEAFDEAISYRNKLLHARPYTAANGAQQLLYSGGPEWPIETVNDAAKRFDDAAIMGNEIFHGDLAKERP